MKLNLILSIIWVMFLRVQMSPEGASNHMDWSECISHNNSCIYGYQYRNQNACQLSYQSDCKVQVFEARRCSDPCKGNEYLLLDSEKSVPDNACIITSPEFREKLSRQSCGNGFRRSFTVNCSNTEICGMAIKSCHVHCKDANSQGLRNVLIEKYIIGNSSILSILPSDPVLILQGSFVDYDTFYSHPYYSTYVPKDLVKFEARFNKWFFVKSVTIEVQPSSDITKCEIFLKFPGFKWYTTNGTFKVETKSCVFYKKPVKSLFIDSLRFFVKTGGIIGRTNISLTIDGYLPGFRSLVSNWSYVEKEKKQLAAKRLWGCFSDSFLSKRISSQYCIGEAEEYDDLDTVWDLRSGDWGKCQTSNPCGYGIKYWNPDVCRFSSGDKALNTQCRDKPISSQGCFHLCDDVCEKVGLKEHKSVLSGSFGIYEILQKVFSERSFIIKEGIVKFCGTPNDGLFELNFTNDMFHLSFLQELDGYFKPVNMKWLACRNNNITQPLYAINGTLKVTSNLTAFNKEGVYDIHVTLSGCDFPKPFLKKDECNVTCGNGTRLVSQKCGKNDFEPLEDFYCMEDLQDPYIENCQTNVSCPNYNFTEWSDWNTTDSKCGTYILSRHRSCIDKNNDAEVNETFCMSVLNETVGNKEEKIIQSEIPCDTVYNFTAWSDWNTAESKCGNYTLSRNRSCIAQSNGTEVNETFCMNALNETTGNEEKQLIQSKDPCHNYTAWSLWNTPEMECEDYSISRSRKCIDILDNEVNETLCMKELNDDIGNVDKKIIRTGISCYSWSECSKHCGNGMRYRKRRCPIKDSNNIMCNNSSYDKEEELCNTHPCPVNGSWSEWSDWSYCSVSCGNNGREERIRYYRIPAYNGMDAKNDSDNPGIEYRGCRFTRKCAGLMTTNLSCADKCEKNGLECDSNMTEYFNDIEMFAKVGLNCLDNDRDKEVLRTKDYHPSYNMISKSCHGYKGEGSIHCLGAPPATDIRVCNCVPKGTVKFGVWSFWSECSKSCGIGVKTRKRSRNNPDDIIGGPVDIRSCGSLCPERGAWGAWGPFSSCNVTCGIGKKLRFRYCNNPSPSRGGAECRGDSVDIVSCGNSLICPVDGGWSEWSEWGSCDEPCNGGVKRRYRYCDNPLPELGGLPCEGVDNEAKNCSNANCISVNLNLGLVFTEETYSDALKDRNSSEYIAFERSLKDQLLKLYKVHPKVLKKGRNFINVTIHNLANATDYMQVTNHSALPEEL